MFEYLKTSWKGVVGVVGVISIITGLVAFDARYAKSEDVKQTFVEVKKSLQIQQDLFRLDSINDQLTKTKIQLRTYPNDKELKEEYQDLKSKKEKLQQSIESGVK